MYYYKIKTEEEFIDVLGEGWRNLVSWADGMDYLFGFEFELTQSQNEYYKEMGVIRWSDEKSMFTSERCYWVFTAIMLSGNKPKAIDHSIYKLRHEIILDLLESEYKNENRVKLDDVLFVNNVVLAVYYKDFEPRMEHWEWKRYLPPKEMVQLKTVEEIRREQPELF